MITHVAFYSGFPTAVSASQLLNESGTLMKNNNKNLNPLSGKQPFKVRRNDEWVLLS